MGRKLGREAPPPFEEGCWVWAEAYLHAKYQLHPSSRLVTTNIRRKLGGSAPLLGGGARSPSNTKSPGPRPSSIPSDILIHAAIWPQPIRAENWRGAVPLWGRGVGLPSNTMWPWPRPTCAPSFILIHPTVWPQFTNVTDRTDRRGQTGVTYRQRSDSIGPTVLQTVAQKNDQPVLGDRYK